MAATTTAEEFPPSLSITIIIITSALDIIYSSEWKTEHSNVKSGMWNNKLKFGAILLKMEWLVSMILYI
jgi:hypothetical protein